MPPIGWMLLIVVVVMLMHNEHRQHRIETCTGCRIEEGGGSLPFIEHSCSRSRAVYRDRRGRLREFGYLRRVATPAAPTSKPAGPTPTPPPAPRRFIVRRHRSEVSA